MRVFLFSAVLLVVAVLLALVEGQGSRNSFLEKLHHKKINYLKDKLGAEKWSQLQTALDTDFSLADILHRPFSLSDFWPFMLLDESPGVDNAPEKPANNDLGLTLTVSVSTEDGEVTVDSKACPETDVCRLGSTCFVFLSGQQALCRQDQAAVPECDPDHMHSCHKLPDSPGYILSSFTEVNSPQDGPEDPMVVLLDKERKPKVFRLEHVLQKSRELNWMDVFQVGVQSLQQLAQNVVVMVADSVEDLQKVLENVGAGLLGQNKVPVGIVLPETVSKPTYIHSQQFATRPDQVLQQQHDQVLLDQLNVALEVMSADEHWNPDLADAAHLDHVSVQDILHAPLQDTSFLDGIGPRFQSMDDKKQKLRKHIFHFLRKSGKSSLVGERVPKIPG